MTKELSALLDGEIERHETPALWSTLKASGDLRVAWGDYHLIGDTLRGEAGLATDITARVMRQLADEPVVLAPRPAQPRHPQSWQRSALAMAASLAGVAVVGWLALAQNTSTPESAVVVRLQAPAPATVVRLTPPALPASPNVVAVPVGGASPGMREYLLAHQANAPGLHLQGGTQHIRTVSAVGKGQ